MNKHLVRRGAPMVYALAIVVAIFIGKGALLAVAIVGAMLLGLLYSLTGGGDGGRPRPGRAARRGR